MKIIIDKDTPASTKTTGDTARPEQDKRSEPLRTALSGKKIVLTGGGSTGHVSVNLALIPGLLADGWKIDYIGSAAGIERELIEPLDGVAYHAVSTGKLRRYIDMKNMTDAFRVVKGLAQAAALLRRLRPDVVFSKGGFVSVPVVIGAKLNRIPVIIHESDVTPGLANRIAMPFASAVCTTFPETAAYIRKGPEIVQAGALVRPELLQGDAARGRRLCGFSAGNPVLLVMGGSLGSRRINEAVREALPQLLEQYQVVHLCGKGQLPEGSPVNDGAGYRAFEYLSEELPDVLAMAELVLSRAGSNAIFELLALRKPMLLVPLTLAQSRGDQLRNAASFEQAGLCRVLQEEELTAASLLEHLSVLEEQKADYRERMADAAPADPLPLLRGIIDQAARQ